MKNEKDLNLVKFQIRLSSEVNKELEKFSSAIGNSKNNCVIAALLFCMSGGEITKFTQFADDYLNGMCLILEDNHALANVVRRNVIAYKKISNDKMEITLKVKNENNNWDEKIITFNINENLHVIKYLNEWKI